MNPTSAFWFTLLGRLATEAALIIALAAGLQRFLTAPRARRTLWQAALLGLALAWAAELGGAREWAVRWRPQPQPERRLTAKIVDEATPTHAEPMPIATDAAEFPQTESVPTRPVWWPLQLWLAGVIVFAARAGALRLWLGIAAARRANVTDAALLARLELLRTRVGLRRMRVLAWAGLRSPIAFGTLRPSVALPADFAARFAPAAQDAMLAHELAHLAARDPFWLAVADVVLALAWWHPGVWWARRQLRAASEAAADEASALVPGGRVALAESLVTFGRELASPGWTRGLGVAGGGLKSELARRVTALLRTTGEWRATRPARLWLARFGGLAVTAALLALPWPGAGEPSLPTLLAAARAEEAEQKTTNHDISRQQVTPKNYAVLHQFDALLDWNDVKEAEGIWSPLWLSNGVPPQLGHVSYEQPEQFHSVGWNGGNYVGTTKSAKGGRSGSSSGTGTSLPTLLAAARAEEASPVGSLTGKSSSSASVTNIPVASEAHTGVERPILTNSGAARIQARLKAIILPEVSFPSGTLGEAVRRLEELAQQYDPEKRGVNLIINSDNPVSSIDPATGQPFPERPDLDKTIVRLNSVLHDVSLGAALAALTNASATPVVWSVEDYAVVFHRPIPEQLYTRLYKVDPTTFLQGIATVLAPEPVAPAATNRTAQVQQDVRRFFRAAGVDFPGNIGQPAAPGQDSRACFFNDRTGNLFVRAMPAELDVIEHALQALTPPVTNQVTDPAKPMSTANDARQVLAVPLSSEKYELADLHRRYQLALLAAKQADLEAAPIFAALGKDSPQGVQATERYQKAKERVRLFERFFAANKELESLRTHYQDGHPKVKAALAASDALLAQINALPAETPSASTSTREAAKSEPYRQVELEVQFVEITEGGGDDLGLDWLFGQSPTNNSALQRGPATNLLTGSGAPHGPNLRVDLLRTEGQSATLTAAQFAALQARLKARSRVDMLAAPKVVTPAGHQARVEVSDVRNVVTGANATPGTATNRAGIRYETEKITTGPAVDLIPYAENGGWRLSILASVTEFLGYDEPKPDQKLAAARPDGKPVSGVVPLPRLRVRNVQAEVPVKNGETVALRGPQVDETFRFKDKVVVLGDIPLLGRLFRKEGTSTLHKRLYVFVTPVEITATGERK